MKRFYTYFGWTIGLGFIIYLGANIQFMMKQKFVRGTFDSTPFIFIFPFIFPIVVGALLRLPKLLVEIKQNKQWDFDWVKFIGIGLPSFCIILLCYSPFIPISNRFTLFLPNLIFQGDSTILTIAGVVFGYILLDSLKK
ncbi:hypothetical protein ACXYMX_16020 [Sporosarcina sp. CAU 1771]